MRRKKVVNKFLVWIWEKLIFWRASLILKVRGRTQDDLIGRIYLLIKQEEPSLKFKEAVSLSGDIVKLLLSEELDNDNYSDDNPYISLALNSTEIREAIGEFHLLTAYYFADHADDNPSNMLNVRHDDAREAANKITPAAIEINDSNISLVNRARKKSLRKTRKSRLVLHRQEIANKKERKRNKINLTGQNVLFFFSVFSALCLAGGFVYTNFLLRSFGIDAENFYVISDYLASSLNKIVSALFSIIGAILGLILGSQQSFEEEVENEYFQKNGTHREALAYLGMPLSILALSVFAIYSAYNMGDIPWSLIQLLSTVVVIFAGIRIRFESFFHKPWAARASFISISLFFSTIFFDVNTERKKISAPNYEGLYLTNADHNGKVFLTNSRFAFFINSDTQAVTVIPVEKISAFTSKP